jgi:hypothetical protein
MSVLLPLFKTRLNAAMSKIASYCYIKMSQKRPDVRRLALFTQDTLSKEYLLSLKRHYKSTMAHCMFSAQIRHHINHAKITCATTNFCSLCVTSKYSSTTSCSATFSRLDSKDPTKRSMSITSLSKSNILTPDFHPVALLAASKNGIILFNVLSLWCRKV